MTATSIVTSFTWTEEEFLAANRAMIWLRIGWKKVTLVVVLLLLIAVNSYIYITDGHGTPLSLVLAVALVLFFVVFFVFALDKQLKKIFQTSPTKNEVIQVEITPEHYFSTAPGKSEGRIIWDSVLKVVEVEKGFLIYMQANMAQWLPHTALADDRETFLEIAEAKTRVIRRK